MVERTPPRLRRLRDRLRRARAGGFSMLEIVAAIVVLGIVVAAAAPQMVASIRASDTAKLVSQAKGVLQGRLDAMRTLPFRVTPAAGDHRDLLDTYFRDLAAPAATPACGAGTPNEPQAAWTGYVPAASTARCSYEAAGVPMYRTVIPAGTGELPAHAAVVLNTMFVSPTTPPTALPPAVGFDSQVAGKDRPPSVQVGVQATVLYRDHQKWKPVTVYTQIASRTPAQTRIKLDATARAVEIGSARISGTNPDGTPIYEPITLTGGQLDLHGSLSTVSAASANLSALSAAKPSARVAGAELTLQAPDANLVTLNAPGNELESGCSAPCWGATLIPPFVVAADGGLPRAGVDGLAGVLNPVQTQLPDLAYHDGFRFRAADPSDPALADTVVSMSPLPLDSTLTSLLDGVDNCAFSLTDPTSELTASGFINSTDDTAATNPLSAQACGGAHTGVIEVLPTDFAPGGLVRITAYSSASCLVSGTGHAASTQVGYRADVEYWKWTPDFYFAGILVLPGHGEYVSAGFVDPTVSGDPLAGVDLSTPVSEAGTPGDYIASWSMLTNDRVIATAAGHVAQVTIPALVTVATTALVDGAEGSAVSFAVGAASCRAEDNR